MCVEVIWSNGHNGWFSETLVLVKIGQAPEKSLGKWLVLVPDVSLWSFLLCLHDFWVVLVILQRLSGNSSVSSIGWKFSFFFNTLWNLCPVVEAIKLNFEPRANGKSFRFRWMMEGGGLESHSHLLCGQIIQVGHAWQTSRYLFPWNSCSGRCSTLRLSVVQELMQFGGIGKK